MVQQYLITAFGLPLFELHIDWINFGYCQTVTETLKSARKKIIPWTSISIQGEVHAVIVLASYFKLKNMHYM